MSDSLWPHGLQYVRLPCPSPTPGAFSNSCPLSQWCHSTISSSVVPFSSCLQSFPASGSFQMSHAIRYNHLPGSENFRCISHHPYPKDTVSKTCLVGGPGLVLCSLSSDRGCVQGAGWGGGAPSRQRSNRASGWTLCYFLGGVLKSLGVFPGDSIGKGCPVQIL